MGHYSTAMRLLGCAIRDTSDTTDMAYLDTIMATLWLMIVYEQKFGDGCGVGLQAHLKGAASVVQSRLHNLPSLLNWDRKHREQIKNDDSLMHSEEHWRISPFVGRMIVWISFLDGAAAFHGIGGEFNRSLGSVMHGVDNDEMQSRLRGFLGIHRYSTAMCRAVWGSSYPQEQLLEDLENRQLLYLYGECGQLRFVLARLATTYASSNEEESAALSERCPGALGC